MSDKNLDILNLTKQQIQKLQYDILYTSIENNGYLTSSEIEELNKQVNTKNKRIIKSINEIIDRTENAIIAVKEFKERFNSDIGDTVSDPELLNQLHDIDVNIIKSIIKLNEKISNSTLDISGLETSIADAEKRIGLLEESVEELKEASNIGFLQENALFVSDNTFRVSKTVLVDSKTRVYINGIKYNTECFDIDNKTFTINETNPSFVLDNLDNIVVEYNYEKK